MHTFVISDPTPDSKDEIVQFVDKWRIRSNMHTYIGSGVIYNGSFAPYKKRIRTLGLCGTAFQSALTVAISFAHRRVWQTFLRSNASLALVLENDAVKTSHVQLSAVLRELDDASIPWNFLQLGRCWDFCASEMTVLSLSMGLRAVRSSSPLCSHAYLIKRSAARTLLQYSLPHVTSVDLLMALLTRSNRLEMLSVTPTMYTQRRIKGAHDMSAIEECDRSSNRNDIRNRDNAVLSMIDNHPMRAFVAYQPMPADYRVQQAHCKTVVPSTTNSTRFRAFLVRMRVLGLQRVVLWRNRDLFDHSSERLHILSMLKHSKHALQLCESDTQHTTHSLIISIGNHFKRAPVFHTSNRYLFYGTPPYAFRRHSTHALQWFIAEDTFSAIDSLDFVSQKRLSTSWIPDMSIASSVSSVSDKFSTIVVEDVDDKTFCRFVAKCPRLHITKIGNRNPYCARPYTFVRSTTTERLRELFQRTANVAFLRKQSFVPRNAYTLGAMNKTVLMDNPIFPSAVPVSSCAERRGKKFSSDSFADVLNMALVAFTDERQRLAPTRS